MIASINNVFEFLGGERLVFGSVLLGKPSLDAANQGKVHWYEGLRRNTV